MTRPGTKLRESLGYGLAYGGICSLLARARSCYQTLGKARGGLRDDYAAWHAKMLTVENRMRGLVGALPGGTVMFGQDSRGNWFAVIGRTYDQPKLI